MAKTANGSFVVAMRTLANPLSCAWIAHMNETGLLVWSQIYPLVGGLAESRQTIGGNVRANLTIFNILVNRTSLRWLPLRLRLKPDSTSILSAVYPIC